MQSPHQPELTLTFMLAIRNSAKPVVKRGIFWFISEAYGFPSPFPHRMKHGLALASSAKSISASAPLSLLSQGVKSTLHDEKPLTRSQQRAASGLPKPTSANSVPLAVLPHQPIKPQTSFLQPPAQLNRTAAANATGRPKRKRTLSQLSKAPARIPLPAQSTKQGTGIPTATAIAGDLASSAQRRAFSASTSLDGSRPMPALRKLKLRLGTVSEAGPLAMPASGSTNASLKKTNSAPRVSLVRTSSVTKQPLSKRARTQSMSQLPSATSPHFPFDNLHLPLLTPSGQAAPEGTVFPLDIHNLPHWPGGAEAVLDILTSRSAPEGGIFSPPSATANIVSGPFSRSHSPSASTHISPLPSSRLGSRRGSSFRSLAHADPTAYTPAEDRASIARLSASLNALEDMHMQSCEFDDEDGGSFVSRSLTDSAIIAAQREVLGLLSEQDYHEDMLAASTASDTVDETEGIDFEFEAAGLDSLAIPRRRGSRTDELSTIDSAGEDEEDHDDTFELDLLRSRSRRQSAARRSQSYVDVNAELGEDKSASVGDSADATTVVKQEEVDMLDEDLFDDGEEYEDSDSEPRAAVDSHAAQRALHTTLCPAAGTKSASGRPGKLSLANRLNSSSSLVFTRSPLPRPATISRTNSRDILNTPVPLAELPVIPLMPPQDLLYQIHGENSRSQQDSRRGSGASTPLTPVIKSEDETDDFGDATNSSRGGSISRLPSQALTEEEDSTSSSADSFRPEAYVSTSRSAGGGEENVVTSQSASRSQSSSRQTSLSPRDSFSPQADVPHADWALTPPSESEAYADDPTEEEEKLLDRATVLGIDSVGMDDLEDAWPGARSLVKQTADLSVFEPVMEAPPLPPAAPVEVTPTLAAKQIVPVSSGLPAHVEDDVEMYDPTHESREGSGSGSSAAMYIAEEETDMSQSTSSLSSSTSSLTSFMPTVTSTPAADVASASEAGQDGKNAAAPTYVQGSGWFYSPERPFDFPISVLLTETKALYYSTIVLVPASENGELESTPLLRRMDTDAVDSDALCLYLIQKNKEDGNEKLAGEITDTHSRLTEQGNKWIPLEYAKSLLDNYGPGSHVSESLRLFCLSTGRLLTIALTPDLQLSTFFAEHILLHWTKKLHKLGTLMRSKNGLSTSVYPLDD